MSIEQDNIFHLKRFNNLPPHPSYIAGFIDGDGCIFIRKIKDGYQTGIQITQCRTNILQIIRKHFGGSITSNTNRNNNIINKMDEITNTLHKYNIRNQYTLIIRSNEYQHILDYIKYSFVIKYKQINYLSQFNNLVNLQNKLNEKEELYLNCSDLNNCKSNKILLYNNINIEYIAGLFDAEGCFYIRKECNDHRISICQKNNPEVLYKIQELLGYGSVSCNEKFVIYNKNDCLKFVSLIKEHLIVKYNQAISFETYLNTTDKIVKQNMYKICNEEKHNIEHYTNLNNNDDGKEMFLETIKLKIIKEQICKEILLKQFYKNKSIQMSSEGNHNYGKSFSEETKKKMSNSIRDAKNGVSDEVIINVRNMIKDGYKNIEIQNILKLPRHTITKIKNGLLVCRTEIKEVKEVLTKEQQSINKRKIKLDEILTIINMTIENKKPMEIFDYLIEERNKNNIVNELTIDIIKNIKRNISNNKIPFYNFELDPIMYNEYTNKINLYYNNLQTK